jgi:hypothetical protein
MTFLFIVGLIESILLGSENEKFVFYHLNREYCVLKVLGV